jgi:hypothetical protein
MVKRAVQHRSRLRRPKKPAISPTVICNAADKHGSNSTAQAPSPVAEPTLHFRTWQSIICGRSVRHRAVLCGVMVGAPQRREIMAQQKFSENLMRAIVAELHVLNLQTAAREMFGRGYFSLGMGDKMAVDQVVLAAVGGNYAAVTPEWLAGPQPSQQPAGFGIPPAVREEK